MNKMPSQSKPRNARKANRSTQTAARDVLNEVCATPVARAFGSMALAEEVLEEHGFRAGKPSPFMHLRPRGNMGHMPEKLIRAHMSELCKRAKAGADLRPGTLAEVLVSLHDASLKAPLRHASLCMMEHCFQEVMGEREALRVLGELSPMTKESRAEMLKDLEEVRQAIRSDDRVWKEGAES